LVGIKSGAGIDVKFMCGKSGSFNDTCRRAYDDIWTRYGE